MIEEERALICTVRKRLRKWMRHVLGGVRGDHMRIAAQEVLFLKVICLSAGPKYVQRLHSYRYYAVSLSFLYPSSIIQFMRLCLGLPLLSSLQSKETWRERKQIITNCL